MAASGSPASGSSPSESPAGRPPANGSPASESPAAAPLGTNGPAPAILRLQQLLVHYPGTAVATLNGLDLVLQPGERLALVGPSGCGKSTVARAVLQLLPPGSRCEGGHDL